LGVAHQFNDSGRYISEDGTIKNATGISLAATNDVQGFVLNFSKFDRRFGSFPSILDTTDFYSASYWRRFGPARIGVNASRQRRANPETGGFNMFSADGYGAWLEYDINPNTKASLGHGRSEFFDADRDYAITTTKTTFGFVVTF